jgi:ferredoxin
MTGTATPAVSGEVSVGVRVRAHPGLCEGWGNCRRFAPAVYPLDADGYIDIHLLDVPADLAGAARLGAQVCPARAITVIDPDGSGP